MRKPVHIVAKEVAGGKKSLPEQVLSSAKVRVMGVGVVRLGPDAPHLVKMTGFS